MKSRIQALALIYKWLIAILSVVINVAKPEIGLSFSAHPKPNVVSGMVLEVA
jgi:hypothetical protein